MNKRINKILIIIFLLSRYYVLMHPPFYYQNPGDPTSGKGYSDVQHDSERYANMWRYGLTPYFEHLYEYPPAAIPLVYIPLVVDQWGIGYYYLNYRVEIFLIEIILFLSLLSITQKIFPNPGQRVVSLAFYIGSGVLAKDFLYDGLDLAMISAYTLGLIALTWPNNARFGQKIISWAFFWLSTAIKLITLPLSIGFLWLKRDKLKTELIACIVGFLLIWGFPLAFFRSSLSVIFVFHNSRPFNYGSSGKFIIQLINDFTHTETQSDILPHLPIVGPASTQVTRIMSLIFPLAIGSVLLGTLYLIKKINTYDQKTRLSLLLKISFLYIFTFLLTSKIFSNPFHIWYIPLISLYPFKSVRQQLTWMAIATFLITLDTTPLLYIPPTYSESIILSRIRGLARFIPIGILLYQSLHLFPSTTIETKSRKILR